MRVAVCSMKTSRVLWWLKLAVVCLQGGSAYAGHADDDKSAHTNGGGVGGGNYATKVR